MVAKYLQCGEDIEYDLFQLLAALTLNEGPISTTHSQMTIMYLLSYYNNYKKYSLII